MSATGASPSPSGPPYDGSRAGRDGLNEHYGARAERQAETDGERISVALPNRMGRLSWSAEMTVLVREYASGDYQVWRRLWAELTEHHRQIYRDPTIGGDDPGSGFDDFLEIPERVTS